jgi:hypothetical protein
MSNSIDALAAWIALIVAVILLVFCASLIWRQQRRLSAVQTQLDGLSQTISSLEAAHHALLVRFMNLPRSRRARKSSSPWSDSLEEKMTSSIAPTQPDENKSIEPAPYIGAPKTSPE